MVRARDEANDAQRLPRAFLPLSDAVSRNPERQFNVLERRQQREQAERLEHEAHLVAANFREFLFPHCGQVLSFEEDLAGRRLVEPGHEVQQRRLARTRSADERNELARRNLQGHVVDGRDLLRPHVVHAGEVLNVDDDL